MGERREAIAANPFDPWLVLQQLIEEATRRVPGRNATSLTSESSRRVGTSIILLILLHLLLKAGHCGLTSGECWPRIGAFLPFPCRYADGRKFMPAVEARPVSSLLPRKLRPFPKHLELAGESRQYSTITRPTRTTRAASSAAPVSSSTKPKAISTSRACSKTDAAGRAKLIIASLVTVSRERRPQERERLCGGRFSGAADCIARQG